MKFAAAALALAAGVSASYPVAAPPANGTTYTTTVFTESYVTYCPEATQITYGTNTYTVTEATSLTITDCPCTATVPVYTTSSVACATCSAPVVQPTSEVSYPTTGYTNTTGPATTPASSPSAGVPTTSGYPSNPTAIPTAGAGKAAALSGAGLAGILGLAAFAL